MRLNPFKSFGHWTYSKIQTHKNPINEPKVLGRLPNVKHTLEAISTHMDRGLLQNWRRSAMVSLVSNPNLIPRARRFQWGPHTVLRMLNSLMILLMKRRRRTHRSTVEMSSKIIKV